MGHQQRNVVVEEELGKPAEKFTTTHPSAHKVSSCARRTVNGKG
jgi:hypothetical protein